MTENLAARVDRVGREAAEVAHLPVTHRAFADPEGLAAADTPKATATLTIRVKSSVKRRMSASLQDQQE